MRKIGSEKTLEEKRRRNVTVIGFILLGVMVLSTIGYAITSQVNPEEGTGQQTQEGLRQLDNGMWQVSRDGRTFIFENSPDAVKNISQKSTATLATYAGTMVYIDSKNTAILSTLGSVLGQYSGRVQEGCYGPCERNLPEKNCTDKVILWRDSPENKVTQTDNCVFIEGDMRAVEAFLYKLLGY